MQKLDAKTLTRFVPRDGDPIESIATDLRFADGPHHALVVGQRGTGKSSELRVLAHQLLSEFFVIVVDVDEQSDIFNVNHVEVLYLLGTAIFAAARVRGLAVPDSLLETMTGSIQTLVRTRTESKDYTVPVKEIFAAIATAVAAATDPSLGAAVLLSTAIIFKDLKFNLGISDNAVSRREVKPQIANISAALHQIVDAVRRASERPLLVIVDGLDRAEFTQGRQIFAESQLLDAPACHMLYVIPAHLCYSPHLSAARQVFGQVYPLPHVKLRSRDGERSARGYDLMRQVIDRRLQEVGCHRDDVFAREALDLLIENSGGMMRELIRLTQNAVRDTVIHKHLRVERSDAEGVVDGASLWLVVVPAQSAEEVAAAWVERAAIGERAIPPFRLTDGGGSLATRLRAHAARPPRVVLVRGLSLLDAQARHRAIASMNQGREALTEAPHTVVLFVERAHLAELIHDAGDFWSWRSGVTDLSALPSTLWPSTEADRARLRADYLRALAERTATFERPLPQRYLGQRAHPRAAVPMVEGAWRWRVLLEGDVPEPRPVPLWLLFADSGWALDDEREREIDLFSRARPERATKT